MNIEQKNTFFIATMMVIVLLSLSAIAIFIIDEHVHAETGVQLDSVYNYGKIQLEHQRKELSRSASYLSSDAKFKNLAKELKLSEIKQYIKENKYFRGNDMGLLFLEKNGIKYSAGYSPRAVFNSRRVLELNEYRDLINKAKEKNGTVTGYLFIDEEIINAVATPVISQGKVLGVYLQGIVIRGADLIKAKGRANINVVLFKSKTLRTNKGHSFNLIDVVQNIDAGTLSKTNINGESYFSKSYPLSDRVDGTSGLYMMLSIPVDEKIAPYIEKFKHAVYASLIIILIAVLIAIQISRLHYSKPIKDLVAASGTMGEGDLNVEVPHQDRKDELGSLSRSLEQMRSNNLRMRVEESQIKDRVSDFAKISSDWLWETDEQGKFNYVSHSVSESIGFSVDQLLHKNMNDIFINDNLSNVSVIFSNSSKERKGLKNVEVWLTTKESYRICLRLNAASYYIDGVYSGYRGTASDVTKLKTDEERLLRLANKDHLTGLSNRARFMEDLEREMHIAERQQTQGALLLIDLDHFKLVNDTAGHAAGDEVIVQIAGLLRKMSRSVDLTARLSGDEFVIAFINTNINQIKSRVNEILKKISALKPMYSGKIMNTSASIGVTVFPDHADTAVELLAKADMAMYKAKSEGRNLAKIHMPDDMQQEKMGSDLVWKDRVHEALESEKFVLAFQPIQPTTGEDPSRFEVLVRMKTSGDSLYYPGDFIPTAEKFGLIRELDTWVVQHALSLLSSLPEAYSHISFTINLSGLSVGEPAMFDLIKSELEKSNIDRSRVIFEVTESAAFQDITRAIEFIDKIKKLGCRIALDDFGVGFSSFSYLKQLHANILKIDGGFIRDINNSKEDQLFVKALVDVARGMGMMTVAEFVETKEVYDTVRGLGVDYVQGYYIGKPVVGRFDDVMSIKQAHKVAS
ncbi:MAG: EAL domain-containing protein [Gammaproteobacteria bacterium]|nr:EAL domain-containing protein [Gammaproteobacteria bacterium]